MSGGIMTIIEAGMATLTDTGRARGPRFGLPVNGALDQYSSLAANSLVGNPDSAPLIEITASSFAFRCDVDILIASTGAQMIMQVNGVDQHQWEPVSVRAGEKVSLRNMSAGVRAYLAVRGSFETQLLLGSCAPDTVVGFGRPLKARDSITVVQSTRPLWNPYFAAALYNLGVQIPNLLQDAAVVEVTDGPDIEEFGATAARLWDSHYVVDAKSNHIGLRLTGPLPERITSTELISRGVPVGAVEAPPGNELLVLHRGRGVTAGYPVLAVVTTCGLNTLAQVRPGDGVTFRRVTLEHALDTARMARDHLAELRSRVTTIFQALNIDHLEPSSKSNS
jgi:biotin-dependent carboxylase-like uncharacterized protein